MMGFLKKLFGSDPAVDIGIGIETRQSGEKHCGVCGFDLEQDDTLCPACGGDPISADEDYDESQDDYEDDEF